MRHEPSERSLDLAEIALECAADSCQAGATLRSRRGLDPLAKEYLTAADEISRLRSHLYPHRTEGK